MVIYPAANRHNLVQEHSKFYSWCLWWRRYQPSSSSNMDVIDYVEIKLLEMHLTLVIYQHCKQGLVRMLLFYSPTRGVFAGGTHPSSPAGDNVIRTAESITIASKGNCINCDKFGELTAKHQRPTGASNRYQRTKMAVVEIFLT